MTESQALRWAETLGEGVVLERILDEDAGRVRWFAGARSSQAWGDTLAEALVKLRRYVEAKP